MKNAFCGSQIEPSKFRHHFGPGSVYQNVPRGTMRHIGIDYTLPNCTGRTSTSSSSIKHMHHILWQDGHQVRTPMSCIGAGSKPSSSKGKACSIALAIASFIVLLVVLSIASLALYMGISNTESPTNAFITFSCAAKVLRGDKFIGALDEKAQKYRRQIEMLYQRSALGSALFSTAVDGFGKDGLTIHFRIAFYRNKLVDDLRNIEKAIKDVFLGDSYSMKPVFINVRFDPRSVSVKQIRNTSNINSALSSKKSALSPKNTIKSNKMDVMLNSSRNLTNSGPLSTSKQLLRGEPEIDEENLPVIQGSFEISINESVSTEKKSEPSKTKIKQDKTRNLPAVKSTFGEASLTSDSYKISGTKGKITKVISPTTPSPTRPLDTLKTSTPPSPFTTSTANITSVSEVSENIPKFKGSPLIPDEASWIPIMPNIPGFPNRTYGSPSDNMPIYTSFTNPGFSFQSQNSERLASTSLKSHPIPVNKIPSTEPFLETTTIPTTNNSELDIRNDSGFIQLKTIHLNQQPKDEVSRAEEPTVKNISSILFDLATSLEKSDTTNISEDIYEPMLDVKDLSGQGQVEVLEVDVEELLTQTTKIPLVTLLPVRSNSGIRRPINKYRFGDSNNLTGENRSFPSHASNQTLKVAEAEKARNVTKQTDIGRINNYQIMGVLNFATEKQP